MGTDGSKTVVVNSVGREIGRPLGEELPHEGRRLQLTIDADIQKATEDAFDAAEFNGTTVVEPSRVRSERFCRGDRPCDLGVAEYR